MTTEEILQLEKSLGRSKTSSEIELWKKAFAIYNEESGRMKLSTTCSSCFKRVLEWHKEEAAK